MVPSQDIGGTGHEGRNWEPQQGFQGKGYTRRQDRGSSSRCLCESGPQISLFFSPTSVWLLMLLSLSFCVSRMRIIAVVHTLWRRFDLTEVTLVTQGVDCAAQTLQAIVVKGTSQQDRVEEFGVPRHACEQEKTLGAGLLREHGTPDPHAPPPPAKVPAHLSWTTAAAS